MKPRRTSGATTAERHARVRELFLAACEHSMADRRSFLAEACGGDDELRHEVESLLSHHENGVDGRASGATQATVAQPGSAAAQPASAPASATRPGRRARTHFDAGDVFAGRYRIIAEIGSGGMGEVFRAHDLVLDEPVAVKLLTRAGRRPPGRAQLTALLNEVRMARQVTHPNVCRVFDFGEAEGETFLTMEYVDGEDLASLLARIGRFPRDKLLDVAHQLASGLAAAHDRGVLHRDLKPANVLIDGRGQVKITDFGIATSETPGDRDAGGPAGARLEDGRLVLAGAAGTPAYMAPEQAASGEVSVQSDLYALGLVFHEMATGQPVFEAETPAAYAELHRAQTPAPPSRRVQHLDPELESVILKCLEKDPRNRPASARALAAALPGGDRLRQLLQAGETPSPETVAAAGRGQALAPGTAAIWFAGLILLLAGLLVLGDKAYPARAPWAERSPEVLADQAATTLRQLGYQVPPGDRAWGVMPDWENAEDETGVFWYRQSPDELRPSHFFTLYVPRVDFEDPPPIEEGIRLLLDPGGRLLMLHATPAPPDEEAGSEETDSESTAGRPHADEADKEEARETDWAPVLKAAGFELAALTATEPEATPPVFADQRAAWTTTGRSRPIEAAGLGGRVVYFDAQTTGEGEAGAERSIDFAALWEWCLALGAVFFLLLPLAAVVLALINLRARRGDLRGARRLALFVVALHLSAWLLQADHAPGLHLELKATLGRMLYEAVVAWLAYIALEPTVRRGLPRALIAWSRLLRGRPADPLVGRSLLTGAAVGTGWALLTLLDRLATRGLGLEAAGEIFILPQLELALAGRLMFADVLTNLAEAATRGVLDLFFLVARRALLKRWWPAVAVFLLVGGTFEILEGIHPAVSWLTLGAGITGVTVFVLMRFGLLTYATALFCYFVLLTAPATLSFSAWFADTGLFALALVAAVGGFGLWAAMRPENIHLSESI